MYYLGYKLIDLITFLSHKNKSKTTCSCVPTKRSSTVECNETVSLGPLGAWCITGRVGSPLCHHCAIVGHCSTITWLDMQE